VPEDELAQVREERLDLLRVGAIDIEGRMPWSSNATFLVNLLQEGTLVGQAIYKPLRGEQQRDVPRQHRRW